MLTSKLRVTKVRRHIMRTSVTRFLGRNCCIPYPRYNIAFREEWKLLKCTAARRTQVAAHSSPISTSRSPHRTTHQQHAWLKWGPPHGGPSDVANDVPTCAGFYFSFLVERLLLYAWLTRAHYHTSRLYLQSNCPTVEHYF